MNAVAASAPLLEVDDLGKSFTLRRTAWDGLRGRAAPVLRAVNGVSFAVERGRTLGIVGESGCGKSTLARCLVRLLEPDNGSVRFEGVDVLRLEGAERRAFNRRVQMVFQDPYGSLNPRLSVGDCLSEALVVHDLARGPAVARRVEELLDLVHLPRDAADRYPHEFSGGQRQRIGIARALAVEPSLIIADEPVSALDVSVQAQIVNLFLELQERLGLALVFITHDLRLVRHVSHDLAVMYLGRVLETGPTERIFSAPRHPYTQALLAAAPQMTPRRRSRDEAVRGELPSPVAPPPGCAFHPRCPIAQPICRERVPALEPRGGDWPVACHLAGSGAS
ncbi:ATP-binding cassette domain-containing protein [Alsobacter sp. SYSU M60028]|uniref:ATP-binding cassette domain-containing protein n=1 Tax=Alsobacter ponti TaxID=2962936 RepID=A0ABT1LD40_9HYPH|nr:oligopeptide/dipeptide ABC transporter ATP-binding protein [Alsobacter ponti]MCP8939419.1 ATP-binding cassette domain-containing protein [Alsobacter ponti]